MADTATKREVPSALKKVLDLDIKVTKDLVEMVNKKYPIETYRNYMKQLEISCHGIPWLMVAIIGLYVTDLPDLWVNLLIALLIDIIVVAVTKAFTRRRRPSYNVGDIPLSMSVDKFSFPSGHATRAVLLAIFFNFLYPLNFLLFLPIVAWSAAVCGSRVLMGRHHILDVCCGVVIGLLESFIMSKVWLSGAEAGSLVKNVFGGEDPWSGA